ncbi:MAG: tripartite tricarboxylate transporter substrate binding protein [Firmicutes bacterium]|jgi:tripartite-type tricarboxylate transporter receptor subunit TctC|nr:tripartite tricarboxylate transporter substrate binding protein [Bacillota bacterium]
MKKICLLILLAMLLLSVGCSKNEPEAEKFPTDNLKIIVPFNPGGAVDVTCRFIAEIAPDYLNGHKIIVENMPGGGAVIGQTFVSKAEPDGYTILAYTSSVVTNPMTKTTTYTHKSFQPVAMYCFDPEVLVVPAGSKFNTLEEFLEYAENNEVSVCTPGHSTSHHIAGMILQNRLGLKFNYIHNEGAAMQVQQLLGGHVDAGLMAFGEAQGQIKDGTLKALGVMHDERRSDFPDVPTFKEKGVDILYGAWRGLAVPKDTPDDVVNTLAEAFKGIINDQRFIEKMTKAGYPIIYRGPDEFTKYVDQSAEDFKAILHLLKKN